MSSTYLDAQTPRAQISQTQNSAPGPAQEMHDIELGTPLPPRSTSPLPGLPGSTPAPTIPTAVAPPDRGSDRVADPRSWWIAGSAAVVGLIIGGIGAAAYAHNKSNARDNVDDGVGCYDDYNGNSHCPPSGDNSTHGIIIAVSLIVPTLVLTAVAVGLRISCGGWDISRADLETRRANAAQRRANAAAAGGGAYNPGAGAAAAAQQQQNQQAWNQGVFNDNQAIGNGQFTSGFVPQPFNF